jgi:hypothetical protein
MRSPIYGELKELLVAMDDIKYLATFIIYLCLIIFSYKSPAPKSLGHSSSASISSSSSFSQQQQDAIRSFEHVCSKCGKKASGVPGQPGKEEDDDTRGFDEVAFMGFVLIAITVCATLIVYLLYYYIIYRR